MSKRYCSLPWLPFGLREWFERNFGEFCAEHDAGYAEGGCKLCHDATFLMRFIRRGCLLIGIVAFLLVAIFGWIRWFKARDKPVDTLQ